MQARTVTCQHPTLIKPNPQHGLGQGGAQVQTPHIHTALLGQRLHGLLQFCSREVSPSQSFSVLAQVNRVGIATEIGRGWLVEPLTGQRHGQVENQLA